MAARICKHKIGKIGLSKDSNTVHKSGSIKNVLAKVIKKLLVFHKSLFESYGKSTLVTQKRSSVVHTYTYYMFPNDPHLTKFI